MSDSTYRNNEASHLKDLIREALVEMKMSDRLQTKKIEQLWRKLSGPFVSKCTIDVKYYEHKLFVTLSNAPLRHELTMGKDKLIKILNDELPDDYQLKELILR